MSPRKLQANRANAQKSTGPRTEEGKAVVSLNSVTHGLRARRAVMLIEDREDFRQLCKDLFDEFQPMTPTEAHLVETIAVNQWKLGRMEAVISCTNLQSVYIHLAFKNQNKYRTERGTIEMPDFTMHKPEQVILPMLQSIQRSQSQIEKDYYRALAALEHMQNLRSQRMPKPVEEAEPAPAKPKVMTAGAGGWMIEIEAQPAQPIAKRRRFGTTWVSGAGASACQPPDTV